MKGASKTKRTTFGRDGSVVVMKHNLPRLTVAIDLPRRLDMEAAIELQHGHVAAAEMLARRAADLRSATR